MIDEEGGGREEVVPALQPSMVVVLPWPMGQTLTTNVGAIRRET
jgi:hypothetical protein